MSKLSNRLKEYIEEKGITQSQLSEATGITRSNISEFISDKHAPSFQNFIALLYYFDCSADYLLGLIDIPREEKLYPVLPFHERLRFVMAERNLSQTKMIKTMPISSSILYKWLIGKNTPTAETLIRIANYLECSVDYLIGRIR